MVSIPLPQQRIAQAIDDHCADIINSELPRPHLGASMLGHHCDRYIWLTFRWAVREQFSGRMYRLFQRGHDEEPRVKKWLESIGVVFAKPGILLGANPQYRVDFGCHVSGSMDGVILSGVPGAEKTGHIWEMKTHNDKSFKDLQKNGLYESKRQHWCQCQLYMHGLNRKRALYTATNKNDDTLYTERIRLDELAAKQLVDRGHMLALADNMPNMCPGASPSWYKCKSRCSDDHYDFCHQSKLTNQVNCRTCAHSTATNESKWTCARYDGDVIPLNIQYLGCSGHVFHPDMVPWQIKDSGNSHQATYIVDGQEVLNGVDENGNGTDSREIIK